MQNKRDENKENQPNRLNQVKKKYSFTLNYHKNPVTGGVGHISLIGENGENNPVKISVHPNEQVTALTPLTVATACIFPSKAVNAADSTESPILKSYDISKDMETPQEAFEELEKIKNSIDSGTTAYSLLPNTVTHALYALVSRNVSTQNVMTGLKTLDREKVHDEMDKIEVTNCSESALRVLKKGGMQDDIPTLLSYQTPTKMNGFFDSRHKVKVVEQPKQTMPKLGNSVDE